MYAPFSGQVKRTGLLLGGSENTRVGDEVCGLFPVRTLDIPLSAAPGAWRTDGRGGRTPPPASLGLSRLL
ncbi:hypothetical protein GGTG_13792 [Gaeumannomyces tritici R3-111a-1]|uniref:Uncharacterized protein n=1 Tax=Gaeumannomyces tritici (strain R3-111a-1) TaxID=644352 RepID=J3PJV3_GAET3|nr:hypothetical protein GGTG_13792 [Gaeumannomyces tritici R3-111a-1]EJT68637.1 hypothetical protein GGTG_13792 [Gaeumannomyces tritici R3-111a-1]